MWSQRHGATTSRTTPRGGLFKEYRHKYRAARLRANTLGEKGKFMASPTLPVTPYDLRVKLVKDTITEHSKISDEAAGELATQILFALNSIPEKTR